MHLQNSIGSQKWFKKFHHSINFDIEDASRSKRPVEAEVNIELRHSLLQAVQ